MSDDHIYCDYDTTYVLDAENSILAFCEESDVERGCGWIERVQGDAPVQYSGVPIANFKQLQELNAQHKTRWRTPEQVEEVRRRAEEVRRRYSHGRLSPTDTRS